MQLPYSTEQKVFTTFFFEFKWQYLGKINWQVPWPSHHTQRRSLFQCRSKMDTFTLSKRAFATIFHGLKMLESRNCINAYDYCCIWFRKFPRTISSHTTTESTFTAVQLRTAAGRDCSSVQKLEASQRRRNLVLPHSTMDGARYARSSAVPRKPCLEVRSE